ncbi:MAG TPA: RluA family pseudouridine synthase [Bryobacteraceae bacterium]|nr:RluA family pseudouridine synthase [Bryobacteraceae bacterium]
MLLKAEERDRGQRLDSFLHRKLPEYSRSRLQTWIRGGRVHVDGAPGKPSTLLRGSEEIRVEPAHLAALKAEPEDIPLTVLYEDAAVVVIDKPAGMVVHAGAGIHAGTVVNALLHRFSRLSGIGGDLRPGIVHRLDRFTTGVLLVAKTDAAHRDLAAQFQARTVEKIYLALVEGALTGSGRIQKPIARDPRNRARMTARLETGRTALTDWKVLENYTDFSLLEIHLGTGRTHQIRAHMAAARHPVAGDRLYGAKASLWNRYFLHAHRLTFRSPLTGEDVRVESPLPPDLVEWKTSLEEL